MSPDANLKLAEAMLDIDVAAKSAIKAINTNLEKTEGENDPIVPRFALEGTRELIKMQNMLLKMMYNENCEITDRIEALLKKLEEK